jgi:predicted nucleic acid-binding Zn ribbon protein
MKKTEQINLFPDLIQPACHCSVCGRKIASGTIGSSCARKSVEYRKRAAARKINRLLVKADLDKIEKVLEVLK